MIEVFKGFHFKTAYKGLGIVPENIMAARNLYPDHAFVVVDATTYETDERFDLVYAAGTMFYVPRYQKAITNMLSWSNRYIGFEVKLGATTEHIVDIEKSYSMIGKSRAFMVVLNLWRFLEWLTAQKGIGRIQLLGYKTPINRFSFMSPHVKYFVSCCVFIEKGQHLYEVLIELPIAELLG